MNARYIVSADDRGKHPTYTIMDIPERTIVASVFRSDVELARRIAYALNLLEEKEPRPVLTRSERKMLTKMHREAVKKMKEETR